MRDSIFSEKLSARGLFSIINQYLSKKGILFLLIFIVTIALSFVAMYFMTTGIVDGYQEVIIAHQDTIFRITGENSSHTQVINILDIFLRTIYHSWFPIVVWGSCLYFVATISSLLIYISENLFVKEEKMTVGKTLTYIVKRLFGSFYTAFMIGILVITLALIVLVVVFLAQFMIDEKFIKWVIFLFLGIILFFRFLWLYKWQATYNYKISGGEACGYSSNMVFKNFFFSLIYYLIVCGLIVFIIVFFGTTMIRTLHWSQYPIYISLIYLTVCIIYMLTNLYLNFWFINRDHDSRAKYRNEDNYKDYITHHFENKNLSAITTETVDLGSDKVDVIAHHIEEPVVEEVVEEPLVEEVIEEPVVEVEAVDDTVKKFAFGTVLAAVALWFKEKFAWLVENAIILFNKVFKREPKGVPVKTTSLMRHFNNKRPAFSKAQQTRRKTIKLKHKNKIH